MERLTNWVFTYNIYTKNWQAARREDYTLLFSDIASPKVLKSKSHSTLVELIIRTGGDAQKIKRLVK